MSARRRRASSSVDEARVEIGVDAHLLAGHGVQGETGRHFRHSFGALGDDDKLDDDQDQKDDETDHVVARRRRSGRKRG